MRLLFDQNLSPKLMRLLADLFPGSEHVQSVGLDCAEDDRIWRFAIQNGFAILSQDEDYNNLSIIRGTPPKVIWLQLGNCTTAQVEASVVSRHSKKIDEYIQNHGPMTRPEVIEHALTKLLSEV